MITSYFAIFFVILAFIDGLLVGGLIVLNYFDQYRACHKKQLGILRRLENIHEVAKGMGEGAYRDNSTALDFIVGESDLAMPQRDFNTKELRGNFKPPKTKTKNNGNNVWL